MYVHYLWFLLFPYRRSTWRNLWRSRAHFMGFFTNWPILLRKRNLVMMRLVKESKIENWVALIDYILSQYVYWFLQARKLLSSVEKYARDNPDVIMLDSIASLRTLINRYKTYCIINKCQLFKQGNPRRHYLKWTWFVS